MEKKTNKSTRRTCFLEAKAVDQLCGTRCNKGGEPGRGPKIRINDALYPCKQKADLLPKPSNQRPEPPATSTIAAAHCSLIVQYRILCCGDTLIILGSTLVEVVS